MSDTVQVDMKVLRPLVKLAKAYVKQHTRKTKSGKVVQIAAYHDKRLASKQSSGWAPAMHKLETIRKRFEGGTLNISTHRELFDRFDALRSEMSHTPHEVIMAGANTPELKRLYSKIDALAMDIKNMERDAKRS